MRGTPTYKGDIVEVIFDGVELENLDTRKQAEDDKDSSNEEERPEDCDDADIPQRNREICQIRRFDDFQSMCAFSGQQNSHYDIATLSRRSQGGGKRRFVRAKVRVSSVQITSESGFEHGSGAAVR